MRAKCSRLDVIDEASRNLLLEIRAARFDGQRHDDGCHMPLHAQAMFVAQNALRARGLVMISASTVEDIPSAMDGVHVAGLVTVEDAALAHRLY